VITNRRITTWLDAQHHHGAIAQRAGQRIALHTVAVTEAAAATVLTRPRPTTRRGAVGAAGAASAGPAAA
jgi:ferric-dicitrate binding protein FerR (iron transport regulator)